MRETLRIGALEVPLRVQGELDPASRVALERLISDGAELERRCRAALLDPTRTLGHGATRLYVEHHFGLMARPAGPPPVLTLDAVEAFVRAMGVRSIWVTPDPGVEFLHVDYTIDEQGTDYVLSVVLDREGVIRSVDMES